MNFNIERDGFALVANAVDPVTVESLLGRIEAVSNVGGDASVRQREGVYAIRNVLDVVPALRETVNAPLLRTLVESILGARCFPVRGILFDKVPGANWKVPWHQDLSIAVRERIEVEGFGPWSQKAGVVHVQPPTKILEQMLTLRLHLDDCGLPNGPLRVIPGSHQSGKLNAQEIAAWRQREEEVVCASPRGGVLLMRPLLLHASSSAETVGHRRVLHIEWAAQELPGGLQWCA
ncbi:MAG TPA: phytanoyl-CoA dioxygenase family protein [Abditibacteriaceae bacterium]|jgi:hypothetical protein